MADTIEHADVLAIVQEDILRILAERDRHVPLSSIRAEIRVASSCISRAVQKLEHEGLLLDADGTIALTPTGLEKARRIVEKHLALEEYYKRRRSEEEAHEIAHLLEHFVSREVLNTIKKLSTLKDEGVSVVDLGLHRKGLITDILFTDYALFERMISLGITPGAAMEVTHRIPSGLAIRVEYQKIAIDRRIAEGIKVVEYARD